jgi:hypothetical protein
LFDGREDEETFQELADAGAFPRLLELIRANFPHNHLVSKLFLELLYEMSRIERVDLEYLSLVDDQFVDMLFQAVEVDAAYDAIDPYNMPVLQVLLVLNEQYLITSISTKQTQLTNKVLKVLSLNKSRYKLFGENIIYILNRSEETSMQLLILKMLFALFSSPSLYEYLYTNDLRIVVDIILRSLIDLPFEALSLRHTFLRVLYMLAKNSQLSQPPHYKAPEITRVLSMLANTKSSHFLPADPTTVRLVERCFTVPWLEKEEGSPARKLGMSLDQAQDSSLSVSSLVKATEKPGVTTGSRKEEIMLEVTS